MIVCVPGESWKCTKYEFIYFAEFIYFVQFVKQLIATTHWLKSVTVKSWSVQLQSISSPTKTYTSTQIWTSLAVLDKRFKTVISDIFQLLLLKSCLYKCCHLMNNIGLYHIHLFMLQNQVLIYPECCYFPTVAQFKVFLFCSHFCWL